MAPTAEKNLKNGKKGRKWPFFRKWKGENGYFRTLKYIFLEGIKVQTRLQKKISVFLTPGK